MAGGGKKNLIMLLWLKELILSSIRIAWCWTLQQRQKSVYSLLNLNINFNSCNRLLCKIITMHVFSIVKDGKNIERKKNRKNWSFGFSSSFHVISKEKLCCTRLLRSLHWFFAVRRKICTWKSFLQLPSSMRKDYQSTCFSYPLFSLKNCQQLARILIFQRDDVDWD